MTTLASATAQPVAEGAGSIGPFAVPSGAAGVQMTIQRGSLPALDPLLDCTCMASFDGGATFAPIGSAEMAGGDITARGGAVLAASVLRFRWANTPTHIRIDLIAATAFNADFSVDTL